MNSSRKPPEDGLDNAPLALEGFLPYRLARAAEQVSRQFAALYRERHGMTRPEWRTLATIGQFNRITATAIGQHSSMHKTKVKPRHPRARGARLDHPPGRRHRPPHRTHRTHPRRPAPLHGTGPARPQLRGQAQGYAGCGGDAELEAGILAIEARLGGGKWAEMGGEWKRT